MLFRKAKRDIENWLKEGKDALLVTGARQVGKTYLIRETLKENHVDFFEINFVEQSNLVSLFQSAMKRDAESFLFELRVIAKRELPEGTVIFFDEIQEIKEIVTMIKFLIENGKYRYIMSGSLLGVELNDLRSAPVGYLRTIDMYPLDLEEFYIANGLGQDVIEHLRKDFECERPVNPVVHDMMIDVFYRYLMIGGMPEAVSVYLATQEPTKVSEIHQKIIQGYLRDFTKYEKEKKLKLIEIYHLIPSELDSKNKRYQIADISKTSRFSHYDNDFNWLIDAGVALPAYNVTEFQIPLEASKKSNLFKLFLSDVGMLTTLYGSATALKLLERGKDINCGAIFENLVCEELTAHGFKTYYFNNKKHGEVDFLVEYKNELLPIEVKSGKDYQKHSALSYFMENQYFHKAIVFSDYNVKTEGNILYLPIYMVMFLSKEEQLPKMPKIELSSLSEIIKKEK